ncbi:MAG: kynureninase [Steroidobacteraceae bacterium]|nr:kynureninase [Steroidobacteraceae bacterium]
MASRPPSARQARRLWAIGDVQALDAHDPLAARREAFQLPVGTIYLCGNSLGPMQPGVRARVQHLIDIEWGVDLIRSWNLHDWFALPERIGARLARILGAGADEVTVADSTSVNLFKVACAARSLRPDRRRILTERGNFPTDAYVLQGIAQMSRGGTEFVAVDRQRISDAIDEDTAVVVLTHVHYKDAAMFDMAAITARAHAAGALIVWDLSHSVGAVPLALDACKADFAIGCTYKYLNGGPGSPAFIYAARRHHDAMHPGLVGWWGDARPFDFADDFEPAAGMRRMLTGTGPVIGLLALDAALDLFDDLDMNEVQLKSQCLSSLFFDLIEQKCAGFGLEEVIPDPPAPRGSHVALRHSEGYAIMQALVRRNVIGDFRAPDIMRFGLTPLYTSYRDVWNAVDVLAEIMSTGAWQAHEYTLRSRVT